MGYESRFYVRNKTDFKDCVTNRFFSDNIARYDMSKIDRDIVNEIFKYPKTDTYFYEGDELVIKDMYGDELPEVPIKDMIEIFEKYTKDDDYRRYAPFLALLKGFDVEQWDNLIVLHYGY